MKIKYHWYGVNENDLTLSPKFKIFVKQQKKKDLLKFEHRKHSQNPIKSQLCKFSKEREKSTQYYENIHLVISFVFLTFTILEFC